MAVAVHTGTLEGVDAVPILVEVDLLRRLPSVVIVGLPGGAVRESADRVRSAIQQADLEFPRKRVVVNLAPADVRKVGTGFDLPIAVGILAASGQVAHERLDDTVFFGELSLEGQLRGLRGALPAALMARDAGFRRIVLPADCAGEAAVVEGVEVLAADHLADVVAWLDGSRPLPAGRPTAPTVPAEPPLDLSEVRGQHRARRALEIAAAGGHNLLLVGAPGCGKTMLAARMPGILPALGFEESIDITRVWSVAGLLGDGRGLVTQRPFRAPHHTISAAGMVGSATLRPGEVSLAHHGVLFLDELPEFSRHVLELLRQPLEDREITLTRAAGTVRLPASVSLVAAANPCPCGYLGHPTRPCACSPGAVERYRTRLSGPLMDRIDLQVWVQPVDPEQIVHGRRGESSAAVRARVEAARARQRERPGQGGQSNAALRGEAIREVAAPTTEALRVLEDALARFGLSARAWARILKVARTIADLDGADVVDAAHVLEASSFRLPEDREPT
ncbi:MAG: YifB family Mg chelatase-like AAA ATPase [Alphaproteobacteria bacterium]|nr:YifB family Mg chelatase-like AAA ATPase [Alphaproteobacteria bacterium]